ncbi:MAG: filamentous hemagglutinin N-terminal domain-containing protein [Spirulina sp.]
MQKRTRDLGDNGLRDRLLTLVFGRLMVKTQRWRDRAQQMQKRDRRQKRQCSWLSLGFTLASCLGWALTATSTSAQISGDGTLDTTVTGNPNFTITGGTTQGTNLFHSFSEFSVPRGGSATFNNSTSIQNIFSRVTGGNLSYIDGAIAAQGTANLFLINPAGITLGSGASLNLGGSFFASTADSILFADGVELNTSSPTSNPLLTVSAPVGLAFKGSRGQIQVNGTGHNRTIIQPALFPLVSAPTIPEGLQLFSGGTLALVGNQVNLNGGIVGAIDGRVEIGSVQSGTVGLSQAGDRWTLTYPNGLNFADIHVQNRASVDATSLTRSGVGLQLAGRRVTVTGDSLILQQNFGSQPADTLKIRASDSLEVTSLASDGRIRSIIASQAVGSGQGADLQIETNQLAVRQGGRIAVETYGSSQGGNLTVSATDVELDGFTPQHPELPSILAAQAYLNTGIGGDITIDTTRLRITNGANVYSASGTSSGNAGDIRVNATESIEVIGGIPEIIYASALFAGTLGQGEGGDIILNTRKLSVLDGARVDTSALSGGRGGNIEINASESVEVRGTFPGLPNPSLINAGGDILDAELLDAFGLSFTLTGDSGDVTIATNLLQVTDNGEVTVRNEGTGNAGTLQVNANRIELKDGGRLSAVTASGEGGNINLQVSELLLMRRGALISAEAGGTGNGGNITINTPFIVTVTEENSDIIANAFQGNGGNIDITAIGIFGIEFRDRLTEFSDITASSQFGVSGTVTISNPNTNPAELSAELSGDVLDPDQQIARGCDAVGKSRFVAIGRGGIPENPGDRRSGLNAWQDVRDLSIAHPSPVTRLFSDQSPVTRDALSLPKSHPLPDSQPLVEATGWRTKADGTVEIYAEANPSPADLGTTDCAARTISH